MWWTKATRRYKSRMRTLRNSRLGCAKLKRGSAPCKASEFLSHEPPKLQPKKPAVKKPPPMIDSEKEQVPQPDTEPEQAPLARPKPRSDFKGK